jgi:hypothetical protein
MKIKFNDSIHNWSEDSFTIERTSRGNYVRITQELESGSLTEVYLSMKDIEQIYDEMRKVVINEVSI